MVLPLLLEALPVVPLDPLQEVELLRPQVPVVVLLLLLALVVVGHLLPQVLVVVVLPLLLEQTEVAVHHPHLVAEVFVRGPFVVMFLKLIRASVPAKAKYTPSLKMKAFNWTKLPKIAGTIW